MSKTRSRNHASISGEPSGGAEVVGIKDWGPHSHPPSKTSGPVSDWLCIKMSPLRVPSGQESDLGLVGCFSPRARILATGGYGSGCIKFLFWLADQPWCGDAPSALCLLGLPCKALSLLLASEHLGRWGFLACERREKDILVSFYFLYKPYLRWLIPVLPNSQTCTHHFGGGRLLCGTSKTQYK